MANTLNVGNGDWATKENSLLGYNSENGNYKPLPFDFTRASNGTFVNKSGLIETAANGVPRIDFLGNTSGALLLEPQRTNLITYSSDFSNASWSKSELSVSNGFISPDGTLNAKKITESTSNSKHQTFTTISSYTELTISFFAKKAERSFISVEKSSWGTTVFNLNDGSVVSGTGSVVDFGNGWYRCSATYTASPAQSQFYILLMKDENTVAYQGDGTSGLYLWGCQAEVGSYATSLINTQGSAVTRVADACSQTPPSGIIGQTEGVLFADFVINGNSNPFTNIINTDRNTISSISINLTKNTNKIAASVFADVDTTINSFSTYTNGQRLKVALLYKSGNILLYINGVLEASSTTTFSFSQSITELFLNDNVTYFGYQENLSFNDVRVYNTRLSNTELQALTS
jgi:hypothetical protein